MHILFPVCSITVGNFFLISGRLIVWWRFTAKCFRHDNCLDPVRKTNVKENLNPYLLRFICLSYATKQVHNYVQGLEMTYFISFNLPLLALFQAASKKLECGMTCIHGYWSSLLIQVQLFVLGAKDWSKDTFPRWTALTCCRRCH